LSKLTAAAGKAVVGCGWCFTIIKLVYALKIYIMGVLLGMGWIPLKIKYFQKV